MGTKQIQGFNVLPLKFCASSTSYHEIFIKEHLIRNQSIETPLGQTLFAANIPPYATKDSIKHAFSPAGDVTHVIFQKRPSNQMEDTDKPINGFKVAYIVFEKPASLQKALRLKSLECLSTTAHPVLCGLKKWAKQHNEAILDSAELQKRVDGFMARFDKKAEDDKKKEKEEGEEDDEGWVTVTKHGRTPGLARKEAVEDRLNEKIERGKKKKELKNFYTFQIRESKMKHLANLRQKFEEDKKKITALKQARRFKPY